MGAASADVVVILFCWAEILSCSWFSLEPIFLLAGLFVLLLLLLLLLLLILIEFAVFVSTAVEAELLFDVGVMSGVNLFGEG